MTYQNLNALRSIATKCNNEMKKAVKGKPKKQRVDLLRPISDKYAKQAVLLGFDKFRLHYEVALLNGVLEER